MDALAGIRKMQTFKKLPTTAPKMKAKEFKNMALSPFYLLKFVIFGIIAELLEGSLLSSAVLLPYPNYLRLRPVTLRPVFSNGLPFSSWKNYEPI